MGMPGGGGGGAGGPTGGSAEGASAYYLLAQASMMIDIQIKRAKQEAEQNFRTEMAKVRRDTQGVQVFTEQQVNVVAAVSKDCAFVRSEVSRLTASMHVCKQQLVQQQQVCAAMQLTLEQVNKKFEALEKKFTEIGLPSTSGIAVSEDARGLQAGAWGGMMPGMGSMGLPGMDG